MPTNAAETAEMLQVLDAAVKQTRQAGREDLAEKLTKARRQLTSGAWHVLVAGEFKKGKSALVNGLLGIDVCGVDPTEFSAVPTIIRDGDKPAATLVVEDADRPRTMTIDPRKAASYALRGSTDTGEPLQAVEVVLPRKLLAGGLVLMDTPGLGGGFASAAAAATMRALNLADGVIVVTDASQELTAAELDFIRHAAQACPNLLIALTKIDFYPQWRKILDLDRAHLTDAELDIEIVAVSATLRELALATGDPALNAECGFPVLAERLSSRLTAVHAAESVATAADVVRGALRQVAEALATEHAALTEPEQRPAVQRKVEQSTERARQLSGSSSRWLNTINDRFADIQAGVEMNLTERLRRVEGEAARRVKEGDPTREWAEIVPWLQRRTNEELTDAHTKLIESIDDLAGEIAAVFSASASSVGATTAGGSLGGNVAIGQLAGKKGGKLEVGMHAARGWSLSSSVVTTLLVTTLHPGLLIALPITAVLGSVFAYKAVRSYKTSKLDTTRAEAQRAVAAYLAQARMDAARAAQDLIRHGRIRIRDYYLDQAAELVTAAKHEQVATERAVQVDTQAASARGAAAKAELDRVAGLLSTVDRMAGVR